MISSQARYDHFDTAPYMLNRCFSSLFFGGKRLWKELTERTAKYSVFRTAGARRNTGFLADKTDTFSKIFESAPL